MNILVIYDYYAPQELRQTFSDFLHCFGKYSSHQVYYCNYAYGVPSYYSHVEFDLIIFLHFFSIHFRMNGLSYEDYVSRLGPIKESKAIKVLFSQDEFFAMDRINRFIHDFNIEGVFSVAEESEWSTIYYDVDQTKVHFHKNLTGYLDDDICHVMCDLKKEIPNRDIDIGYRATRVPAWLGRQGKLKVDIAPVVKEAALAKGMHVDIATVTKAEDFFLGYDWYKFMLRCKAFIGVEGGSSIFDRDGSLRHKVNQYVQQNPDQSFEEIEAACFPGMDGNLALAALSPRHLEACVAKCCQILVEGSYGGILKPGIHYLELKKDFSNLNEVLELVQREDVREELADRAFHDVVESGLYTYKSFVEGAIQDCLSIRPSSVSKKSPIFYRMNQFRDWLTWKSMPWEFYLFKRIKKCLPQNIITTLKTFRNRSSSV
ncbi:MULTISPECIES: hypothetical protein [Parachlamydia]|uniref:hypothetical protein n=1 Tax=Parachlamydia TaxID=83551 RepID=UPI0001C17CAF|nr:hypothetical protein [Parachlamydia acanthamoebae]EFB41974.1 hypothetical protein pah_c017o010 [Parachlamydia acanthamoebae str. Hall's coccus]